MPFKWHYRSDGQDQLNATPVSNFNLPRLERSRRKEHEVLTDRQRFLGLNESRYHFPELYDFFASLLY